MALHELVEMDLLEAEEPERVEIQAVKIGASEPIFIRVTEGEPETDELRKALKENRQLTKDVNEIQKASGKLISAIRALIVTFGIGNFRCQESREVIRVLMKPLATAEREQEVAFKIVRNVLRINGRWNHQAAENLLKNSRDNLDIARGQLKEALQSAQQFHAGRCVIYWCSKANKVIPKVLAGEDDN